MVSTQSNALLKIDLKHFQFVTLSFLVCIIKNYGLVDKLTVI